MSITSSYYEKQRTVSLSGVKENWWSDNMGKIEQTDFPFHVK